MRRAARGRARLRGASDATTDPDDPCRGPGRRRRGLLRHRRQPRLPRQPHRPAHRADALATAPAPRRGTGAVGDPAVPVRQGRPDPAGAEPGGGHRAADGRADHRPYGARRLGPPRAAPPGRAGDRIDGGQPVRRAGAERRGAGDPQGPPASGDRRADRSGAGKGATFMTLKRLFVLNGVIAGGYGIALLVAADPILDVYGITPNPEGVYMARWFGLGLLAIGLSTWLARDAADAAGGQAVARALAVTYGIGVVLAMWGTLFGPFNVLGWIAVGLNLLLGSGFAWFQLVVARART